MSDITDKTLIENKEEVIFASSKLSIPAVDEEANMEFQSNRIVPFKPYWAFGIGVNTKLLNLTKNKSNITVFYAVSHIGIYLTLNPRKMQFLIGHKNPIISTAVDNSGTWLVTADSGLDHSIVIWDAKDCLPVFTLYNPHNDNLVVLVAISGDAKYLISVGKDGILLFWEWTKGNYIPDDTYRIKPTFGKLIDLKFDHNNSNNFALTFSEGIIFLTWNTELKRLVDFIPDTARLKAKNYGYFMMTSYIKRSHYVITATNLGWILVWGLSFERIAYDYVQSNNNKIFIMAIRLQKDGITYLLTVDNYIVTGDVNGLIKFYDMNLKILHWCQNFRLHRIFSMNFNIEERNFKFSDDPDVILNKKSEDLNLKTGVLEDDRSDEYEVVYKNMLPADLSLKQAPFLSRDFIVVTAKGQIGYIDMVNNKYIDMISIPYSQITALTCHDEKPLLCFGFSNGVICLFNYLEHKMILQEQIMKSKEEDYNKITCISYSRQGLYMACSSSGGHLWFLEPSTIKPYSRKPFIYDKSRIISIKFSPDNRYLAYYDSSMAVCLLKRSEKIVQGHPDWIFHGRYIAHFQFITDMLFLEPSQLFTISQDVNLVEYDVANSEPGKLKLKFSTKLMASGYPMTFMKYATENVDNVSKLNLKKNVNDRPMFMVSSSEHKYYLINETGNTIIRKILGPTYSTPVQKCEVIPNTNNKYMIFLTDKYLGIQMLPLSGNPFKRVTMLIHPIKIKQFQISSCGNFVFTIGKCDNVCVMWKINTIAVEQMRNLGGKELSPYYCLIEGGPHGWLFQEMKDLFYYVQILHEGENSSKQRSVHDKIPTSQLSNLMRAIGFFPSEANVKFSKHLANIMYEVTHYYATAAANGQEEINFGNFVKLYINHRPVNKYYLEDIQNAFNTFAINEKISREDFIEILTTRGEPFTKMALRTCLSILIEFNKDRSIMNNDSEGLDFSFLPKEITCDFFVNTLLGIAK